MKPIFFYILLLTGIGFCVASCTKDKGNYIYHVPPMPVVHLDTLYYATLGDSLVIDPKATISDKAHILGYAWEIQTGITTPPIVSNGAQLKIVFTLAAARYFGKLTIIDSANGQKYFYSFIVQGNTIYAKGTLVLSQEAGVSQLSFVLPDSSMQLRIYKTLNGTDLPPNAQQLIPMINTNFSNGQLFNYWIISSQGSNPGVQLNPNTLLKIKTMKDNFFTTPSGITPGQFSNDPQTGVLKGVLNGQIYMGAWQTAFFSDIYGQFGLPATGDYQLFPQAIFNPIFPYFLGYESGKKQVVAFTNFGSPSYIGTGYIDTVTAPSFDPTNVGLNMLDFEQINASNCYMFGKAANDSIYELEFGAVFQGIIQVNPVYKRAFARQDLIKTNTKWASSPKEIFFFSSGSTIYEYNPLNQSFKPLTTDFGGKEITMLKASADGNTLTTGVDGSVFFLDVSTGKYGDVIRRIDNIPGSPMDVYVREN
ncbi:PKD-like family lipoprotein [Flavitalea flava]